MSRLSYRLLVVSSKELKQGSEFLQAIHNLCAHETRWELDVTYTLESSLARLASRCYDIILFDASGSMELGPTLSSIQERQPTVALLAYTKEDFNDECLSLFEIGLQDFLTSDHLHPKILRTTILTACARQRLVASLKSKSSLLQRRLEDQVGYLRKVVLGTHDGVIIVDQQGIVRLANPTAVELFDRNEGELLGSYFGYPLANERAIELTIESRNRGPVTAEMRVTRIEWDNRVAYLATIHDVSRYKNQAVTLKAAEEAAIRSSQLKSEFLANMSHEIRTPLNGVLGMVQLLNLTKLQPYQEELLKTVQASGDHLLVLINDILDMSKIEAGKLVLEVIPFEIEDLIREVMAIHAPAASLKRVCLIGMVEPGIPETICGDQVRLRQVLSNLVGNAVKFTDVGDVTLRVSRSASATSSHCIVGFEVSDTGLGIARDRISELFQPFNQVHTDTTKGGTGLGLSISKRLVNLMKGEISVSSTLGEGSKFRFDIPFDSSVANESDGFEFAVSKPFNLLSPSPYRRSVLADELNRFGITTELTETTKVTIIDLCSQSSVVQKELLIVRDDLLAKGQAVIQLGFLNDSAIDDFMHPRLWTLNSPLYLHDLVALFNRIYDSADIISQDFVVTRKKPTGEAVVRRCHEGFKGVILLAEDNIVNQQVALRYLAHLGFETECVANGQEAVDATNKRSYAAILMDYRMPVLDGVQATLLIRALQTGKARVPIIAFTANAQEIDRKACTAAGMDGFLTKPLRISDLQAELLRVLPAAFQSEAQPLSASVPEVDLLDYDVIQGLLSMGEEENDPDFPGELFAIYIDVSTKRLDDLRQSVREGDLSALHAHAHTLKGSSANVGALRLTELCRALEGMDLSDMPSVEELLEKIERAFHETKAQLLQVRPALPERSARKDNRDAVGLR